MVRTTCAQASMPVTRTAVSGLQAAMATTTAVAEDTKAVANFAQTEFSEVRSIEEGRDSSLKPRPPRLAFSVLVANYYGASSAAWHGVSTSGVVGSSCGWQLFRASSLA